MAITRAVKTRVVNRRDGPVPADAVLIDRSTKWGNPFRIGRDGTREECIAKFREYVDDRPDLLRAAHELRGKTLV